MFYCLLCHASSAVNRDLCSACYDALPWNHSSCPRCSEPLVIATATPCQRCISTEPFFDQCLTPWSYRFPMDQWILQGKNHRPELLTALARLSAYELKNRLDTLPDLLLPIPLHPNKQKSRGYNQTGIIARILGNTLQIPVHYKILSKVRESSSQKDLSREARQSNLERVFRVNRPLLRSQPKPIRHIALIDDVVTTGSTVNQLAKQLRNAGIERVDAWALARTPKKYPA